MIPGMATLTTLQVLAEPRRQEILDLLRDGELPVGDLVARLSEGFRKALATEDLKRSFAERGATAEFIPPETLAKTIEADVRKWSAIAKGAGAKPE